MYLTAIDNNFVTSMSIKDAERSHTYSLGRELKNKKFPIR